MEEQIFATRSNTFYLSAQFFPAGVRQDVVKLYSLLRTADDYVDRQPPQLANLQNLYQAWAKAEPKLLKDPVAKQVVINVLDLQRKHAFRSEWLAAFFDAMFMDVRRASYQTLEDSLKYVNGSGEVIGLMMAKIMGCQPEGFKYAKLQGRAFQWINFIRDLNEDNQLGRCYFPKQDLQRFGLANLLNQNGDNFKEFMHFQLARYHAWQNQAQAGHKYIPEPSRSAVELAVSRYNKIAQLIDRNPTSVFQQQTKAIV